MVRFIKLNFYFNSMKLALDNGIRSIAFPSISTGAYGFPVELAAKIAVHTVNRFLQESHDQRVLIKSYRQSMATAGCFS